MTLDKHKKLFGLPGGSPSLDASLGNLYASIVKDFPVDKAQGSNIAFRNFLEFVERLLSRYGELLESERRINDLQDSKEQLPSIKELRVDYLSIKLFSKGLIIGIYYKLKHRIKYDLFRFKVPLLKDLQSDFVNKTEAFHQQIYSAISSFIKLSTHIAPNIFKNGMPRNSVERFLGYIELMMPHLKSHITPIQKSRDFRSSYIDHTQSIKPHDWFTITDGLGRAHVIYFQERGRGDFFDMSKILSYPDKFRSPFPAKTWCVPPHHQEIMNSFNALFLAILEHYDKNS